MYKFILLLSIILFGQSETSFAQNKIKWITMTEAIEKSKVEKRKIFVDVYTEWCGWCKRFDKTTLSEDHIAKYMNSNYYNVKLDAEYKEVIILNGKEYKYVRAGSKGYHELAFEVLNGKMSYPTIVFLNEDFTLIQPIPGFQDVATFEMISTFFGSNSHKVMPWNRYMNIFDRSSYFNIPVRKN